MLLPLDMCSSGASLNTPLLASECVLLQTLNVLCFRSLPGSQELNQQLANHFTEKVEHFIHISQHVLGHIGHVRHAYTACIQNSTQFVIAATPSAALPAAGGSPATPAIASGM